MGAHTIPDGGGKAEIDGFDFKLARRLPTR
jgi:hypothetical protein